ncbi:FCS-Like Zinc finger 5-like protein [Drosera capensis]
MQQKQQKLGKRTRKEPIKRTTSVSEFNFDAIIPLPDRNRVPFLLEGSGSDPAVAVLVSPKFIGRRKSCELVAPESFSESFLRACSLCNRRLVPGRDIYMYRGDTAYCSQDCRQQQMNLDEVKEKAAIRCSVAATKAPQSSTGTASLASSNADPIAAAMH